MPLIQKIYDHVHAALWATLLAFVLWFSVVVLPTLPQMRARAEMLHNHGIAAEQDSYCEKLGMGPKTAMYRQCTSSLEEYRAIVQQDIAEQREMLF